MGPGRKRYYQYTAIDDCNRLRVLRAYPRSDQKTAIEVLDYIIFSRLPFEPCCTTGKSAVRRAVSYDRRTRTEGGMRAVSELAVPPP